LYFVARLLRIEGATSEYRDFVLHDRNRIRWGADRPEKGEKLYVHYEYYPTYRVVREMPNLRSSENQVFPRRAAVKLLSGYQAREGL
jgi:hypothetical protein